MSDFKTMTEMDEYADRMVAITFDEKYSELEKRLYRLGLTAGYLQAMRDSMGQLDEVNGAAV